MDQPEDKEQ